MNPDSFAPVVDGNRLGKREDGSFGRTVSGAERLYKKAIDGGHVDNHSPRLPQVGHEFAGTQEDASHVDCHLPIPLFRRSVLDFLIDLDRSIVHQDVQWAKLLTHKSMQAGDGLRIRDIRLEGTGVTTLGTNGRRCCFCFGSINVHQYCPRPFCAEGIRDRASDLEPAPVTTDARPCSFKSPPIGVCFAG